MENAPIKLTNIRVVAYLKCLGIEPIDSDFQDPDRSFWLFENSERVNAAIAGFFERRELCANEMFEFYRDLTRLVKMEQSRQRGWRGI